MADENFSDNLLRAVAAELHLLNRVTAAREMFSKSYFSLGMVEKVTVDQTVASWSEAITKVSRLKRLRVIEHMNRWVSEPQPVEERAGCPRVRVGAGEC